MAYTADHGRNAAIWLDLSTAGTMASSGTADLKRVEGKNSWTSDFSRDFVDTTSFGDSSKTNVAGLPAASIDISGNWNFAGEGSLIKNIIGASSERACILFPDYTNYPTWYCSGKVFASMTAGGGVDQAVTLDLHLEPGPSGLTWTMP
jgi:hypothetical protein